MDITEFALLWKEIRAKSLLLRPTQNQTSDKREIMHQKMFLLKKRGVTTKR
jgi:hypothetical protein